MQMIIITIMGVELVSFADFLHSANEHTQSLQGRDVSQVLGDEDFRQHMHISPSYGSGWVTVFPLMAGSTLVAMEFEPNTDIEIFQRDMQHSGLGFTLCIEGCVKCRADSQNVVINTNQSSFQRCQTQVRYGSSTFHQRMNNKYVTLHLSHEWLSERGRSLGLEIVNDRYWSGLFNLGECNSAVLETAQALFDAIGDLSVSHHKISALSLQMWALQLEQLRKVASCDLNLVALKSSEDIARIHRAAKIIRDNFQSPPDLLSLARRVGINDHKLKCGFKELYQETVFSYLRKIRMNKARELLAQSNYSITRTSHDIGYESSSHFAVAFKKAYGITPSDYQKRILAHQH